VSSRRASLVSSRRVIEEASRDASGNLRASLVSSRRASGPQGLRALFFHLLLCIIPAAPAHAAAVGAAAPAAAAAAAAATAAAAAAALKTSLRAS